MPINLRYYNILYIITKNQPTGAMLDELMLPWKYSENEDYIDDIKVEDITDEVFDSWDGASPTTKLNYKNNIITYAFEFMGVNEVKYKNDSIRFFKFENLNHKWSELCSEIPRVNTFCSLTHGYTHTGQMKYTCITEYTLRPNAILYKGKWITDKDKIINIIRTVDNNYWWTMIAYRLDKTKSIGRKDEE